MEHSSKLKRKTPSQYLINYRKVAQIIADEQLKISRDVKRMWAKTFTLWEKNHVYGVAGDWETCVIKGSDPLITYGHEYHDGIRRVFSTVATCHPNSDLFFLNINERTQRLEMLRNEEPVRDIVMWRMQKIHDALLNKHKQTFWIDVDSRMSDGQEYMMLKQVEYTRSPNVGQFDTLLAQNIINIDISVGRAKLNPNTGRMSGADNWNFRIGRRHRNLLFPQAAMYNLE